jgi:hypothetical protein
MERESKDLIKSCCAQEDPSCQQPEGKLEEEFNWCTASDSCICASNEAMSLHLSALSTWISSDRPGKLERTSQAERLVTSSSKT